MLPSIAFHLHSTPLPIHPPNHFSHPSTSPISPPLCLANNSKSRHTPLIQNRIVRHRYEILNTFECGISLFGTEIKSIRSGRMNLREGFCRVKNNELFLHNVHISPCQYSHQKLDHQPMRIRKLLLHKRDIRKLAEKEKDAGITLVPTKAYFNKNGWLKVEIALVRGKNQADKRETVKRREQDRELRRIVKASVTRY